ncbi:MAG: carbohydrate kinase family protein [Desulfobacterales bacterium]|nr:carbohydrate kinase family protein [Desulfobacterales bacterium]
MTAPDILVIGRGCLDHIGVVARYPHENAKVPVLSSCDEGGGQGATAACCIRRLGETVRLVGRLGDDPAGQFCRQRLEDFGVDHGRVQTIAGGQTPEAHIFVTQATGQRTIFYQPSTLPRLTGADLTPDLFRPAGVVLLDPETTYLASHLPTPGPRAPVIIYDAERWRQGLEEMMRRADYFIPSSAFFEDPHLNFNGLSFNEQFERLAARIDGTLIVTRGRRGAYFRQDRRLYRVPAPEVHVRDTIGAGDNFHAAFAVARLRRYDLARAVKFAVAVASLSCRAYGGREGVPTNAEALERAAGLEVRPVAT